MNLQDVAAFLLRRDAALAKGRREAKAITGAAPLLEDGDSAVRIYRDGDKVKAKFASGTVVTLK